MYEYIAYKCLVNKVSKHIILIFHVTQNQETFLTVFLKEYVFGINFDLASRTGVANTFYVGKYLS